MAQKYVKRIFGELRAFIHNRRCSVVGNQGLQRCRASQLVYGKRKPKEFFWGSPLEIYFTELATMKLQTLCKSIKYYRSVWPKVEKKEKSGNQNICLLTTYTQTVSDISGEFDAFILDQKLAG